MLVESVEMVKYSTVTLAYGFVHSLVHLWDRKGSYYNHSKKEMERRELLHVDKLVYAGLIMTTAPVVWPFMVYYDVRRGESALRCGDAENFKTYHLFLDWPPI